MNYLVKSDDGSNDNRRHIKQDKQSDKQNGRGRKKIEEDLDFFLDNNDIEKKWQENQRKQTETETVHNN